MLQAQTKPNTCATGGGACEAWAGTDPGSSANKDETSFGCPPPAPWSNQLDVSTGVVGWAALAGSRCPFLRTSFDAAHCKEICQQQSLFLNLLAEIHTFCWNGFKPLRTTKSVPCATHTLLEPWATVGIFTTYEGLHTGVLCNNTPRAVKQQYKGVKLQILAMHSYGKGCRKPKLEQTTRTTTVASPILSEYSSVATSSAQQWQAKVWMYDNANPL